MIMKVFSRDMLKVLFFLFLDSSGQAEKHFQFFTADRSFKLTALRSDPNIKSPNPFLKIYHAQVADSKWRCNDCGKEFVMKETLEKHKSTIHEGNAPFKCPYCSKGFTMEQSYHAHIYVHTGKRPFECNICSRGFAKKESLIKHMENHNSSNGMA